MLYSGARKPRDLLALALRNASNTSRLPRAAARGNREVFDAFRKANAKRSRGFLAPEYNIRAIEAAVDQPFDAGLATERKLFVELMTGTQSAAQRYVFFAERQVWKIPDVPEDTQNIPVQKIGIIG